MSECNHNCSSCSSTGCPSHVEKPSVQPGTHIGKIIGVLSGKGGVGKSFVTSLLAVSLAKKGYRVGIMDADITGPSIPRLFSLHEYAYGDEKGMYPVKTSLGIKVMSINLMLDEEDTPVLWRGPIVSGAVMQFYNETYWEDLDYLLIDMPPGTSDVALSVLQDIPVDGLIMVSSPSKLVSMVVSKAIVMAEKTNTPILGIVENMSYVRCDECGHSVRLYPQSSSASIAEKYHCPVLCECPLDPTLSTLSDEGRVEEYEGDLLKNVVETVENCPKRNINIG